MARLADTRGQSTWLREWVESLRPVPVAAAIVAAACGVGMALAVDVRQKPQVPVLEESTVELCANTLNTLPSDSAAATYLALLQDVGR
jgi:hypothetical protein